MTSTQQIPPPAPEAPAHDHGGWRDLAPVAAVLVLGILLSLATGSFPVVAFVLAVVAMVMLHELGHFLTAKWSGMKVTEFFFGFGPRLWSTRRGETEYGV